MSLETSLTSGVTQLGLALTPEVQEKMLHYLTLLQKWNKVYSLTAIREPQLMVSHHLLDSLAVLPQLWPGRWLDVGCGAGLPGVVLALARPGWDFVLLDSNSKKTSFVQQAVIELGLRNVTVCCARVEEWHPSERFDGIISRAFASLADFTTLTRHLLNEGGSWVAMKGMPEQGMDALPPGVAVQRVVQLQVPELDAARCLVILKAN